MLKKKPSFNWNAAVRSAIRRVFARSPKVREVMNSGKRKVPHYNQDGSRAKVDRLEFHCQICDRWIVAKLMSGVDHIVPVVSVEEGFRDWNTYIARIDCDPSNLQRVCSECHTRKSNDERNKRNALKDKAALDIIEDQIKAIDTLHHAKDLLKQAKKFTTKKKADSTKQRAQELIIKLKDIIERQD